MTRLTQAEASTRIIALQAAIRACPKVYAVYVRCDGEISLEALYDSKEAAEIHRDNYNKNNRAGYYGKASVSMHSVQTLAIAQERLK